MTPQYHFLQAQLGSANFSGPWDRFMRIRELCNTIQTQPVDDAALLQRCGAIVQAYNNL